MGAATITKAINDFTLAPKKIILEMPFGSILQAGEGRIRMMHLPAEPLATMVTFWGGIEHGFWAFSMKPAQYAKKMGISKIFRGYLAVNLKNTAFYPTISPLIKCRPTFRQ